MRRLVWIAGFLVAYALHAAALLGLRGRLALPLSSVELQAMAGVSLALLLIGIVLHAATLDEVQRRIALVAGAAAGLVAGGLSWGAAAVGLAALAAPYLWAVATAVFLVVYGAMAWRAAA